MPFARSNLFLANRLWIRIYCVDLNMKKEYIMPTDVQVIRSSAIFCDSFAEMFQEIQIHIPALFSVFLLIDPRSF